MDTPRPADSIQPMGIATAGSDDGIAHTGGHYLNPLEVWEDVLLAPSESSPDRLRQIIRQLTFRERTGFCPWDKSCNRAEIWWSAPFREPLEGGLQAYSSAILAAFKAGPGDWVSQKSDRGPRFLGAIKGGVLVVLQRQKHGWLTVSAFRRNGPTDPRRMRKDDRDEFFETLAAQRIEERRRNLVARSADPAAVPLDGVAMDMLRRSFDHARRCVESRSTEGAAWVVLFLVAFERLERATEWSSEPEPELLTSARELVQKHKTYLGEVAALAIADLPALPREGGDQDVVELELLELLDSAESQALVLPYLPKRAAAKVEEQLEELTALIELEPERFAVLSAHAVAHLEEQRIAPRDPRWVLWSKVPRAAMVAREPVPETVPDLKETLNRAWQQAERDGLVEPIPSLGARVLAQVQAWLQPAPVPAALYAATERPTGEKRDTGPGRVPLLLYDPASGSGRFVTLSLRVGAGRGLFGPNEQLRALAWEAVRGAFHAAAHAMPSCWPAYPLEEHSLEISGGENEPVIVDGESLGLPVALAFLSLWANQPLPSDLAATGQLFGDPGYVGSVAGIQAKTIALLQAWGSKASPRLLVAAEHADAVRALGVDPVKVANLKDAIDAAGLDLTRAKVASLGSIAHRLRTLEALVRDVVEQQLEGHRVQDGTNPWLVLADRIRTHFDSLECEQAAPRATLDVARVNCALAYTHAGHLAAANALLEQVELRSETPSSVRVLKAIVELNTSIDESDWAKCRGLIDALGAVSEKLTGDDHKLLLGRVQGTQGRALMHQRMLAEALPLLEAAVAHHAEHEPHEAGRSRTYLAMGLRMADRLEAALDALEQAEREIDGPARRFSKPYAEMCEMYRKYELARVLLVMDQPEESAESALEALRAAEWRGWWPTMGILRTLAWALAAMGSESERAELVARMRDHWLQRVPKGDRGMAQTLIAEAEGPATSEGEVY